MIDESVSVNNWCELEISRYYASFHTSEDTGLKISKFSTLVNLF